jgi:hypothetical protein
MKIKIRRKDHKVSNDLKFLGFDQDGIRNLSKDKFA